MLFGGKHLYMLLFIPKTKTTEWGYETILFSENTQILDTESGLVSKVKSGGFKTPFIIKILKSEKDLSLQVHPSGQHEVWVPVYGEHEKSNGRSRSFIGGGEFVAGLKKWARTWMLKALPRCLWKPLLNKYRLLNYYPIFISSSTPHSLLKGNRVLEIQVNIGKNDTYRFGDLDSSLKREYQFNKANSICSPHSLPNYSSSVLNNFVEMKPSSSKGLFYLYKDALICGSKYQKGNLIYGDIGGWINSKDYETTFLKIKYNE